MQTTKKFVNEAAGFIATIAAEAVVEGSPLGRLFSPLFAYSKDEKGDYVPTKPIGVWIRRKPKGSFSEFLSVFDDGGEPTLTKGEKSFLSFLWKEMAELDLGSRGGKLSGGSFVIYANSAKGTVTIGGYAKGKLPKGAK